MKVSSITSNINNSDCTNKNSTNKQEEKNPEFGLMLEKSENDLISSENSITDEEMANMNYQVETNGKEAKEVAITFLKNANLLK